MTASRLDSFQVSLLVTEEDIRRLHSSFTDLAGPPEWTVTFSDGLDRTYAHLEEVLAIENPPTRRVTAVGISSPSTQSNMTASLTLTDREYANVTLHLNGLEEAVIKLNQHIEDRLQAMRPWYARAISTDFVNLVFTGVFVLLGLSVAVIPFIPSEVGNRPVSSETQVKLMAKFFLAVGGAVVVGWLLNRLRSKIFPATTFALGQGKARDHHLNQLRYIVVSLAVGAALTLAVTLLKVIW